MSRTFSLNVREAESAASHDHLQVALIVLRQPGLDKPWRFSSDNGVRLSRNPLRYGTRSTWQNPEDEPYQFVVMAATVPGDGDDGPTTSTISIMDPDGSIASAFIGNRDEVTIDMAVVFAAAPDEVLRQWLGRRLTAGDGDGAFISFEIGNFPVLEENYPAARMTADRCPALFE